METPSMDTIYQAINALYNNPNASEKEKASLWLGDIQKSIHSWKIADQLLQQKKDIHSCYFAAQTMRSKVQHNLSELPPESLVSLRDSLVTHLEGTSPETSAAILTQLSLALVDLALQMPSWQNCISDIIKSFSNKNDFALLEVLTVLPQEIDSSSLKLGENRREDVKADLRSNAQVVTSFLKESINNSQNTHIVLKIIKCMTSWIQVRAINIQEVPQNAVIGYCLQLLMDHSTINTLHDAASDCLCALLHCLEENNNNDNIERLLFDSICALEESYHMAVAHEEEEKAANYARVFTELAESFLEKMIVSTSGGSTHFATRSLELALVCVGHHDYEVAEITFNLWYRLSEEVYQRDYQPLTDAFKPHIERLIEALARHCQYEPDHTQLPDEGDEFFDFRIKVMEVIKDVVFIVGSSSVFRQMFAALHSDISWEQTEAALFVMQSVAKNILPDEYEYVPKVVEAILSMPEATHLAVRKTCILLLGELCEWIDAHSECLEPCVQFLLTALQHSQLTTAAATALQHVCKACGARAGVHAGVLVSASRALPHAPLPLLRAAAHAIAGLPHQQLITTMREAVSHQTVPLSELVKSNKELKKNTNTDPAFWLDRIATLFRDAEVPSSMISNEHPCMPALTDAWPVLQEVMNKYSNDGRVIERLCRCIRWGARRVGKSGSALLPAQVTALAALYDTRQHSAVLYVAGVLVDELATPGTAEATALLQLLRELLPRAFHLLQQPDGLRDNPDTVDDLFRLCIRYLQRVSCEFASSGALRGVVQCACLAAPLDHRDASASVMKFLHDLLRAANAQQPANEQLHGIINEIVSEYGEAITTAILEAAALHLHSYLLADVADVMLQLLAAQKARGASWLQTALLRLPRDRVAVPTPQQQDLFHHAAIGTEKCKEMTRLLRDFARLYR